MYRLFPILILEEYLLSEDPSEMRVFFLTINLLD